MIFFNETFVACTFYNLEFTHVENIFVQPSSHNFLNNLQNIIDYLYVCKQVSTGRTIV